MTRLAIIAAALAISDRPRAGRRAIHVLWPRWPPDRHGHDQRQHDDVL